jgi:hypothetical protein
VEFKLEAVRLVKAGLEASVTARVLRIGFSNGRVVLGGRIGFSNALFPSRLHPEHGRTTVGYSVRSA